MFIVRCLSIVVINAVMLLWLLNLSTNLAVTAKTGINVCILPSFTLKDRPGFAHSVIILILKENQLFNYSCAHEFTYPGIIYDFLAIFQKIWTMTHTTILSLMVSAWMKPFIIKQLYCF